MSKILEKAVSKRLAVHKESNNLRDKFPSAYHSFHSTEIALVRIQNDLLKALDDKKCCFLVMLDLSAAFYTVDHGILIARWAGRFGIRGSALEWIKSYLHERGQFVTIKGCSSDTKKLDCNVPQGSVLGPDFYSDYNNPVTDIFKKYGIGYHQYADDTQVYVTFCPGIDEQEALATLEACLAEVRQWFASNSLRLNDQKTEFIIIGRTHNLQKVSTQEIAIGKDKIDPTASLKNIGAIFDQNMSLEKQLNNTCKSAWYKLYQPCQIRKYLTTDQLKAAVHAYVTSILDQNNSLLKGLPKTILQNTPTCLQNSYGMWT